MVNIYDADIPVKIIFVINVVIARCFSKLAIHHTWLAIGSASHFDDGGTTGVQFEKLHTAWILQVEILN